VNRRHENKTIIVITGPESCGKTSLCNELAAHYKAQWVPEFARVYIQDLGRPYTIEDVEVVAKKQVEQYQRVKNNSQPLVFFDTFLIITKVWFTYLYGQCPIWLNESIMNVEVDLYLLCKPDLRWIPDSVRENGHIREELFRLYKEELEFYGFQYKIVEGDGQERNLLAKKYINHMLLEKPNYDK